MIISLVCCVGHSVPFHLFPFSCSSDVSSAFQASVACSCVTYCLITFSSGEAMMDTSCSGLSLVFLESWLHHARLLCGGSRTALTTGKLDVLQLWLLVVSSVLNSDGTNIQ